MPFDSYDLSDFPKKQTQMSKKREKIEIPESMKYRNSLFYKNNRMQQIRGFCNTIIYGSSVQASEIMGVTQAAVSSQIASLERDLELKLFNKKGRGLEPTEDGMRFFDYILPIMHSIDNAYDEFLVKREFEDEKILRIGATNSALTWKFPKWVAEFMTKYPDIKIKLYNINDNDMENHIKTGKIDFGFYHVNNVSKDLFHAVEFNFILELMVSSNHKFSKLKSINVLDIKNENFLLLENWQLPLPKGLYTQNNRISVHNFNGELLRHYVEEGIGISFFTNALSQDQKSQNNIVHIPINDFNITVTYSLVSMNRKPKQSMLDFADLIASMDVGFCINNFYAFGK